MRFVLALVLFAAPAVAQDAEPTPWTHQRFDDDPSDFTFAIVSDLQGRNRPGVFDVAVESLNLFRPELVMSVGDFIAGYIGERDSIHALWDAFDAKVERLRAPFYRVAGNHDISSPAMRAVWEERYGRRYYHFVYKDVLFLVIDTEDLSDAEFTDFLTRREIAAGIRDSDPARANELYYESREGRFGMVSDEQAVYFERAIAESTDVRWTFLFMHKPAWLDPAGSGVHRIEAALKDRPYVSFNGHWHNYMYYPGDGSGRARHINLGTTGGGTNDGQVFHRAVRGYIDDNFIGAHGSFDHVTLVTVRDDGPSIVNVRLDGILDETGRIPSADESLCFSHEQCTERSPR